jgi:hypothetical protein
MHASAGIADVSGFGTAGFYFRNSAGRFRPASSSPSADFRIINLDSEVGGLHHRYERIAA